VVTSGAGGMIESVSRDPLFEFDLVQVDVARWLDIGQPGTRAIRRQWRASWCRAGSAWHSGSAQDGFGRAAAVLPESATYAPGGLIADRS
jgi:hypothetical protein